MGGSEGTVGMTQGRVGIAFRDEVSQGEVDAAPAPVARPVPSRPQSSGPTSTFTLRDTRFAGLTASGFRPAVSAHVPILVGRSSGEDSIAVGGGVTFHPATNPPTPGQSYEVGWLSVPAGVTVDVIYPRNIHALFRNDSTVAQVQRVSVRGDQLGGVGEHILIIQVGSEMTEIKYRVPGQAVAPSGPSPSPQPQPRHPIPPRNPSRDRERRPEPGAFAPID